MKNKIVSMACIAMVAPAMAQSSLEPETPLKYFSVPVIWVKDVQGDFSFAQKWEYAIGITRNKWGEIIGYHQPGMEPPGVFKPDGHLNKDSIESYYKKIDTTHYYYNVHWESNCFPKRNEADDVMEVLITPGNIFCTNSRTAKSNCKFKMSIAGDTCYFLSAVVDVMEVNMYNGVSGDMEIDRIAWQEGKLKARFSFLMRNPYNPEDTHYWRGVMHVDMKGDKKEVPDFTPDKK